MLQKRNSEREAENGDRSERSRLVETIKTDQRIFFIDDEVWFAGVGCGV